MVEKIGSNDQRPYDNSFFLEKSSLLDVDLFSRTFHEEMPIGVLLDAVLTFLKSGDFRGHLRWFKGAQGENKSFPKGGQ